MKGRERAAIDDAGADKMERWSASAIDALIARQRRFQPHMPALIINIETAVADDEAPDRRQLEWMGGFLATRVA